MSYMVPVIYDGKKIVPGPYISIARNIERSPDGTSRKREWIFKVIGKITSTMGSPDNDGVWWTGSGYPPIPDSSENSYDLRVRNLRNKLNAFTELFETSGKWFEIQPADGSAPIKFQPRINSFTYQEGPWLEFINYEINMEADCLFIGEEENAYCVDSEDNPAEEQWTIEPADDFRPTFRLTHTVSSYRKKRFDDLGNTESEGYELAQETVQNALGYSTDIVQNVFGIGVGFSNFNYNKSQTLDKAGGRFTVVETWILCEDNYIEDQAIDIRVDNQAGRNTVTINGTITGLNTGTDPSQRYTNALALMTTYNYAYMLSLAQTASGFTLNPNPLTSVVSKNQISGIITYSIDFDDRLGFADGILSQQVSINIDKAVPVVAEIPVINRLYGPVPQSIGTVTQQICTITATLTIKTTYGTTPTVPTYDTLAKFTQYIGSPATVWVASDREEFEETAGRYTRTTSFKYQSV